MHSDRDLPAEVTLLQAAVWLLRGERPIPEDEFDVLGISLTEAECSSAELRPLLRALHTGQLPSYGGLGVRFADFTYIDPFSMGDLRLIPPTAWHHRAIEWNRSALRYDWFRWYEASKLVTQIPDEWVEDATGPQELDGPAELFWYPVELSTNDLLRVFPLLATAGDQERMDGQTTDTAETRRRGRPPKYSREEFYTELIVLADLDGLPPTQAECERVMAQWCEDAWGKSPATSVIRDWVGPIYRHSRKAQAGK